MMPNNTRISPAFQFAALLLLALQLPYFTSADKTYAAGPTIVSVSQVTFDANNSTERCVTYSANAPEKYDTACFTSWYTDGGTFHGCEVNFQEACNSCGPCTTAEDTVGFTLDCKNAQPKVDTEGLCTEYTDFTVQQVLVGNDFDNLPFDWEAAEALEAGEEESADNSGNTDTSAAAGRGVLSMILLAAAVVLNLIA